MRTIKSYALAVGMLLAVLIGQSQAADIVDQGHFFSAEAIASGNRTIKELESKYHHQIHVETYATVPEGKADAVSHMSKAERDEFFVSWIKERAKATNAEGFFLLICKEPAHVHAGDGRKLSQDGFTHMARQRVVDALLGDFRQKHYDEGLAKALAQLGGEFSKLPTRISSNAVHGNRQPLAPAQRVPQPPPAGSNWGGILTLGAIVLGGLFLLSLLGRMFNRGGQGYGGMPGMGPGMGGGGGGFGSGLMGGLFGALAGNWLYNSFGNHGQAFGQDRPPHNMYGSGPGESDSFPDSGGGNDFSGGDFGGGDFGGGDDFGGGGGGDFGGGGDGGGDF